MDDWDFEQEETAQPAKPVRKDGINILLFLLGLVMVSGLSFLAAWLTRDTINRPFWMMGLIFMVPAGSMLIAAMLIEFSRSVMTQSYNRGRQMMVAIIAALLTFVVGCACDAVYLLGGYFEDTAVNYVFALDSGDTLTWETTSGQTNQEALKPVYDTLLDGMTPMTNVGVMTFNWEKTDSLPLAHMSGNHKSAVEAISWEPSGSGVSYVDVFEQTLNMIGDKKKRPTTLVIVTTGFEAAYEVDDNGDVIQTIAADNTANSRLLSGSTANLIQRLADNNCTVYAISPDGWVCDGLREIVLASGGQCLPASEAASTEALRAELVTVDGDMIRADSTPALILTIIMLVLEGLIIGGALSLMLSLSGQFRVQSILSPLLGLIAAILLKIVFRGQVTWIIEGACFSLLGIVLMRSNKSVLRAAARRPVAAVSTAGASSDDADFSNDGDDW